MMLLGNQQAYGSLIVDRMKGVEGISDDSLIECFSNITQTRCA